MKNIANTLETIIQTFMHNSFFVLFLLAILWIIQIISHMNHKKLNRLGLIPRHIKGLRGIIFMPFLHGDFNHLFFNSIPFFVLANLVLIHGRAMFYIVSLSIMLIGGILIWLFGKRGIHIGASSLVMGYFGYLLANAYFQLNAMTVILAIICLYYFGGLVLSLFPSEKHVSWEGHLFGCVAGIFVAKSLPTILLKIFI